MRTEAQQESWQWPACTYNKAFIVISCHALLCHRASCSLHFCGAIWAPMCWVANLQMLMEVGC